MRQLAIAVALCIASAGLTGCGAGAKKTTATVNFSMTTQPKQPLPEQYMRIAVYNADVIADAGSDTFDEKKWREMAADFVQSELQRAADEHNIPIKLVDREHMKASLGEKDMAAAGMTEGGDAVSSSALAGANAILTSKITIKVDKQSKTEYKQGHSFRGIGFGGGEKTEESRNITVSCQFQLKDVASNEIIYGYTGKPRQHHEGGKGGMFKKSKTEVEMTPRDEVIGSIIEKELAVFMSRFVPVKFEDQTMVEPSNSENCKAGVSALNAEDWETALTNFKAALAEKPADDKALFGAAVACEKLGQFEQSRKYYKQALGYEPEEEAYLAGLARVEDQLARQS